MNKEQLKSEIKLLYKLFLIQYIKLEHDCGMTHSVSCSEMFYYLLSHGYLSYNKVYQRKNYYDISFDLIGAQVITGTLVCRHASSMLCDIFLTKSIPSHILGVYMKEESVSLWDKIFGNHALALIERERIFDPFNHDIYYPLNKKKLFSLKSRVVEIKRLSTAFINFYYSNVDFDEISNKVCLCKNYLFMQDQILMKSARKNCEDKKELFEKFYEYNKELYSEINDKFTLLKKM